MFYCITAGPKPFLIIIPLQQTALHQETEKYFSLGTHVALILSPMCVYVICKICGPAQTNNMQCDLHSPKVSIKRNIH